MMGEVIQASQNPLGQHIEKELGIPVGDLSWARVRFPNGAEMILEPASRYEKVSPEGLLPPDPDWKPLKPADYYRKERLGLGIGDRVVWLDEEYRIVDESVQDFITPGMEGIVISLHDGCPPASADSLGEPALSYAKIIYDSGVVASVDPERKYRREVP